MPHRSNLYSRWSQEVKRNRLFKAGECVGVAVSGGPDSILLLEFMKRFAREAGLRLAVVHFNHQLRGPESERDEQFVAERAKALGLMLLTAREDTGQTASSSRKNLEAMARELRYRFFFALVSQGKVDKIVTAHNADDQAETVLLRLLRGTGTKGLGGIYPVLEGKIFRPFLGVSREEIEKEIRERELEFVVDSSNRNRRFQRNKIRMDLLPRLKADFNPELAALLKELSDRARDDEEVLEQVARERAHPWRVRDGSREKIPVQPLKEFPAAVQRRVLRQMALAAKGNLRGITHRHVEAVRHLALNAQSGRRLLLPGGVEARKDFEWLIVQKVEKSGDLGDYSHAVKVPGNVRVSSLGVVFDFKIIEAQARGKTYNKQEVGGLDPRKLPGKLVLRNWRPGDRYQPLGSVKLRKLKELLTRHKISSMERKSWPVLESKGKIVWVRGFPPAADVAASSRSGPMILVEELLETGR